MKRVSEKELLKGIWLLLLLLHPFVHIMEIQVMVDREIRIETEVKEIRKSFYCELCNKQYKLAV